MDELSVAIFHEYFVKPQWLLSLDTDFKWLALRLGLGHPASRASLNLTRG